MKLITEVFGMETTKLELSGGQYVVLDVFLQRLGIRSRITEWREEDGRSIVTIQAENVYKAYISREDRKLADRWMTEAEIEYYKHP